MFIPREEMYERGNELIGAINRDYQNALQEGFLDDSRVVKRIKEDLSSVQNVLQLLGDTSCSVFFAPMFESTLRTLEQKYLFRQSV